MSVSARYGGQSDPPFSPQEIHNIARRHRAAKIGLNEESRVISFRKAVLNEEGVEEPVRINVYYTTGTVGTALKHPRKGKTQLFRKCANLQEIEAIFNNPRVHTGLGYQRRANMPPSPSPNDDAEPLGEWEEVTGHLSWM